MAEKIDLLLKDDSLRKQMSENALSSASRYDWSAIVTKYIDVYRKLL